MNTASGTTSHDGVRFGLSSAGTNSWLWNKENGKLYFGTNNFERRTILSNGNVGIGDITPDATLDVEGTVKIGTNGLSIGEIRQVTGTTSATNHYISFSYPTGYTNINTRVLSLEVNYNNTMWMGLGATNDDGS